MKYEMSQGQYRDFLNTLTYNQQNTRTATTPSSTAGTGALSSSNAYRSGLDVKTLGVIPTVPAVYGCNFTSNGAFDQSDDGEWIACNWVTWADGAAYCDWAGLRPMTELEYEKACRGSALPVANEFAWGSTNYTKATGLKDGGTVNESVTSGNLCYDNGTGGPLRTGAFASAGTNRQQSGAGYWGIMELSGNLWERCVTIHNTQGRSFTGVCGDGMLDGSGNANVAAWPGTDAAGAGSRGASWANDGYLTVSGREYAADGDTRRTERIGFRGVR